MKSRKNDFSFGDYKNIYSISQSYSATIQHLKNKNSPSLFTALKTIFNFIAQWHPILRVKKKIKHV